MVGIFQSLFVVEDDVDGEDDDVDAAAAVDVSSVVGNVTHSGQDVVVSGIFSKPKRTRKQFSSMSILLQLAYASKRDVICCIQLLV